MRTILISVLLFSLSALAEGQLSCLSKTESGAINVTLTLSEELQQLTWWDHTHNQFQIAKYKGIDSETEQPEYGYLVFHAEDDSVDGGEWVYKVAPEITKEGQLPVIEIYRFEGKVESRNEFTCN